MSAKGDDWAVAVRGCLVIHERIRKNAIRRDDSLHRETKPAFLPLVDVVLQNARGGDVIMLVAKIVRRAH